MKLMQFWLRSGVVILTIAVMTLPAHAWPKGGKGGGGGGNGGGGEDPATSLSFVWTSIGSGTGELMNNFGDVAWEETSNGTQTILVSMDDGNGGRQIVDLKTEILADGLYAVPQGTDLHVRWPDDMNDDGQTILWIQERVNNQLVHQAQYLYTPPRIVNEVPEDASLDLLPEGADSINNAGIVAGSPPGPDVFIWDYINGTATVGSAPAGYGTWQTPAINLFGEIAVEGTIVNTNRRIALKFSPASGIEKIFSKDPYDSSVTDINESGTIVGFWRRRLGSSAKAFRCDINGSPEDIPFGGGSSEAVSINNIGDVLGLSDQRPHLYTDSAGAVDILDSSTNAPNVHPNDLRLRSINDQRQILIVDAISGEMFIVDVVEQTP